MSNTIAETINPFNKDAKYEARLRTLQDIVGRQNTDYERLKDLIQTLKNGRAELLDKEQKLTDKLSLYAKLIKAELEGIERNI